jgi:hypothetical protein
MRIIVNHLTRMQPGYICVAGVDVSTHQHIRPVTNARLTTAQLATNGGLFALGSLIDLGKVQFRGTPPQMEDHLFTPHKARVVGTMNPAVFWQFLQNHTHRTIREIFGPAIQPLHNGCVVARGAGTASLGCLLPAKPPYLYISNYGKIRIQVTDGDFSADLSVTDIRLCEANHVTPKKELIARLAARMQQRAPVILSAGLTRAWARPEDNIDWHWLQVNNIHVQDFQDW